VKMAVTTSGVTRLIPQISATLLTHWFPRSVSHLIDFVVKHVNIQRRSYIPRAILSMSQELHFYSTASSSNATNHPSNLRPPAFLPSNFGPPQYFKDRAVRISENKYTSQYDEISPEKSNPRVYASSRSSRVLKVEAVSGIHLPAPIVAMQLSKRRNWARHEAGVIVVFCIVFIVATGIAAICISRCLNRRRAARASRK